MDQEVTQIRKMDGMPQEGLQFEPDRLAPQVGPGTVLSNYRLGPLLAEGFSGEVFRAHNLLADKPCAVKVLRPQVTPRQVAFGRFVHDVRRISGLGHPSIADVYSCSRTDGRVIEVMDLLPGTPLRNFVRQRAPLSRRTYLPVVRGVCEALAAVHALGLCHGNLHGGQVLVSWEDRSCRVFVLDFAMYHLLPGAKDVVSEDLNRTAEHALYLSPEQAKGQLPDARSDLYSLSVMLYEMITGKVPFLGDSFKSTLEQHLSETPVSPGKLSQIPAELEDALMRGLEKDPRKRTPSVEALYAALDPRGLTGRSATAGAAAVTGRSPAQGAPAGVRTPPIPGMAPEEPTPHPAPGAPALLPEEEPSLLESAALRGLHPRRRLILGVALAVTALVCGGVLAYLFLSGRGKGSPAKPPRVKKSPPARAAPRPPASPARPRAVPAPARPAAAHKAPPPAQRPPAAVPAQAAPPPPPAARPEGREPPPAALPEARSREVEVIRSGVRGEVAERVAMMQKVEGFGSLRVITGHPSARVFLDGNLHGSGEVVVVERLSAGVHRVFLEVEGRRTPPQDVNVQKDQNQTVSF